MSTPARSRVAQAVAVAMAVAAPAALTAVLLHLGGGRPRDYVFLYLGVVAALGVTQGLVPALVAAAAGFLLVDFYLVRPVRTLSIGDAQDVVNLVVFFTAAGVVGGLGSRRRSAQLRAEALSRELQAANASVRVRREFLANVSHELRTPLAGILTASTVLARGPELPAAMRDQAEAIAERARRLDRLVGDMLDMARIEGNSLDLRLEQVDLGDAVLAAADRLQAQAAQPRVSIEVPPGTAVVADWDRLGQVLDNLLLNAARFAPEGTPIRVRAAGAGAMVELRVSDSGPGIAAELREHVFERFVHGPAGGDGDGIGLGLAIVRGLAEAQGGRAWVDEPEGGRGACIAVSLPEAPPG